MKKPRDPKVEAFIEDIIAVYRKHGMSIGHEDHHGNFLIEYYGSVYVEWLRGARDVRDERGEES